MYNNFRILEDEVISLYFNEPMKYFINLQAPKIFELISPQDEFDIYDLIRSDKSVKKKISTIDSIILKYPYFKRIGTGTNRMVYKNLDHNSHILKIAFDMTALQDGPREFVNQKYLAPLCTKIFEVSPNDVITSSEYVTPIKNYHQFKYYSDIVYDIIVDRFISNGILLDDIGFSFYKNWGLRFGFPILLDFPYMYKFDDFTKFKCDNIINGIRCNGDLDFDDMLNYLWCPKCGRHEISLESIGLTLNEEKVDDDLIINNSAVFTPKVKLYKNGKLIKDTNNIQNRTNFIESLNKYDNKTLEEIINEEF